MAIEPKFEKISTANRVKLGVTQAVIECKLPANDEGEITKVLCANAKSYICNTEIAGKEVKFNGNVNFQVIYENDAKEVNSLDYTADFKDKFFSDKISGSNIAIVTSGVVDINTAISGRDVKVVAIVEICVEMIEHLELTALTTVEGASVYYNTETVNVSTFAGVLSDKFETNYDIEIKDNVSKVLEVSCSPYIENVTVFEKYVKVVGGANVDICYITNGEQQLLRTHQSKVDFAQEVALDNLMENSCVQSLLDVNNSQIKVTTNIDVDYAVVNLNLPFTYTGYAFNNNDVEIIDDVFSTTNYLKSKTESFDSLVCGGSLTLENKVTGNVESDDVFMDEVLGTCCNAVTVATTYIQDESLIVEGVASTTVMYLNKETNNTYSTMVEMPFSISEKAKDVDDGFVPVVNVSLGEVSAKVRRGKELDVSATLFVYADFYGSKCEAVISELEEVEEKPESNTVLTIYVVKPNETIWEISKRLNINPDNLLEQNANVELPLKGGEKLIVYKQRETIF